MFLKLNILESLQYILYIQLNTALWLIMIKHTDTKLYIDPININAHREAMRRMLLTRRTILILDGNGDSF